MSLSYFYERIANLRTATSKDPNHRSGSRVLRDQTIAYRLIRNGIIAEYFPDCVMTVGKRSWEQFSQRRGDLRSPAV